MRMQRLFAVLLPLVWVSAEAVAEFPKNLANSKSGISVTLSGTVDRDWAMEQTYADPVIADQVLYLKSSVAIALAHNERNSIMMETAKIHRIVGINGADGKPDSGDEGDLYYKIDRDLQAHSYAGTLPPFAIRFAKPFTFDALTYDGSRKVLGAIGDNGGPWGKSPMQTAQRFAFGQTDASGNEWHTLTFWDDDLPVYKAAGIAPHRQGASDGYCYWICVNPKTPVIQLAAENGEQFYTTPPKTYFVPKIWEQTSYLTSGVRINLVNLTDSEPVFYRVDGGAFAQFDGTLLTAGKVFTRKNVPSIFEVKCGEKGPVLRRTVVLDPAYPAGEEKHGYLLWKDEATRQTTIKKLQTVEPFRSSYKVYSDGYYQGGDATFDVTRGAWRASAGQANLALANAFLVGVGGPKKEAAALQLAKNRLLRIGRLEAVGFEGDVNSPTPAKDFLNELGQTIVEFANAGVAYDLLAGFGRADQAGPGGMTPIEEIAIRDGLAKISKTILQFRDNWSAISGSGDTHWAHGYEQAVGIMALAMPIYQTPYYGASGGDRKTTNTFKDAQGRFWNPLPEQGVTWYQAATDPEIPTPGYPGNAFAFRANFLLTDDGWWSGPNDLIGDADRYVNGPLRNTLVDVKHGGLANAECRVELIEEGGYEAPFITHTTAFDYMRRVKGDGQRSVPTSSYIRRRLMNGVVPIKWDAASKTHRAQPSQIHTAILAFNPMYDFASLPGPKAAVTQFLDEVSASYGVAGKKPRAAGAGGSVADTRKVLHSAYALALCADPETMPSPPEGLTNNPPVIKPLFKAVIKPGETFWKDLIACDLDGDAIKVTVEGLPAGATYASEKRRITWTPDGTAPAVHMVTVIADDGKLQTRRPFLMIIKPDAGQKSPAPAPQSLKAVVAADKRSVGLTWPATDANSKVTHVLIYRDGILWAAVPAGTSSYTDSEWIYAGSHTRYNIAFLYASGAESVAVEASPAVLHIPVATPPSVP